MSLLSCDSLAPEGCSEGVCDACCNALSHYLYSINATAEQTILCAACVAHECTGAPSQLEDTLETLGAFFVAHAEVLLTALAALPILGRASDFGVAAVRRRLCPKRKVIVMSCPEHGTLRRDGKGPYDQPVMDKVAELLRHKVLKMGFDRAGSSTAHPEDADVDWSDPQSIKRSRWMYGFRTAAKKVMAIECQSFDGVVVIVCIFGGPVTRVEHELMESIIAEAKADAALGESGIECRIERRDLSYAQFLREYDEGCLCRSLCGCCVPRCVRQALRDCGHCRLPECCVCDRGVPADSPLAAQLLADTRTARSTAPMAEVSGASHGSSRPASPDAAAGAQPAEAELSLKHPVGQVVWVRDDANRGKAPWIRGPVEGHDPASGQPLVRAVEGRSKNGGSAQWSAAECVEPRVWRHLRTAAPGFTNTMLIYRGSSWGAARDCNGLSPRQAVRHGALTLLGWHLLQPALYFYVFFGAFSDLDRAQQVLGSLVAVREGVYALSVLACVAVNPAFLLVNARATARNEDNVGGAGGGYGWLALYVLAPEKFVVMALTSEGGLDMEDCWGTGWFLFVGPLLDLCGMAALGAGLGAGHLPPPLAVGYSVTTAGALLVAAAFIHLGIKYNRRGEIAAGVCPLVFCVLPAFLVPLLVLAW